MENAEVNENDLEIYRQRYETFRHLDRLRWQMLQILVAVGTATTLVLRATLGPPEWWFFALLGLTLLMLAFVLCKINLGLRRNGEILKIKGAAVGDTEIPDVSSTVKSASFLLTLLIAVSGAGLLACAFFFWL